MLDCSSVNDRHPLTWSCRYTAEETPVAVYCNLHQMLRQCRLDAQQQQQQDQQAGGPPAQEAGQAQPPFHVRCVALLRGIEASQSTRSGAWLCCMRSRLGCPRGQVCGSAARHQGQPVHEVRCCCKPQCMQQHKNQCHCSTVLARHARDDMRAPDKLTRH